MAQIKGADISEHQGTINLDALAKAVDFVIVRSGYGGGGVDKQIKRNRDGFRARGTALGFYFFAYPSRGSGKQQAQEFKNTVGDLQAGEFIALDMEDEPSYGRRLVASDVAWAKEFCDEATRLFGVKPLVYLNSDVLGRFDWSPLVKADYGLWLANYGSNNGSISSNPGSGEWPFIAIHQYTSKANLGGISPLDMNIFTGDSVAQLKKYGKSGGGSSPAPKPTPTPAPAPQPAPSGDSFNLPKETPGYVNSVDAMYGRNSNSTVPAGTYAVFSRASNGAVNITRKAGVPGWWINPNVVGAATSTKYYTVKSGDNLSSIANANGTSVSKLVEWNKGNYPSLPNNPNYIVPGWKLRVR